MRHVLLAWELGANLGHVKPLLALALALRDRGHTVTFALRGAREREDLLSSHSFPFVRAPAAALGATGAPSDPASYPELLLHAGFGDPGRLATAAHAWRRLYGVLKPDLILFDHAPVALLAARGVGIPRAHFGTGFTLPPRVSPFPSYRPWAHVAADRLASSERRVLESANAALKALDTMPLGTLCELLEAEEDFLATLPELDHYANRQPAKYWGPVYDDGSGDAPIWPEGRGKQVFVYIRRSSPAFDQLFRHLRDERVRALWFAPDLNDSDAARLSNATLRFVTRPLNISGVAAAADAAIFHAGHGTVAAMLQHGVFMLLLPENVEQLILARNVHRLGAGTALLPTSLHEELEPALRALTGARRLATRSNAILHEEAVATMSHRMEEMMRRAAVPGDDVPGDKDASSIATPRYEVSSLDTQNTPG